MLLDDFTVLINIDVFAAGFEIVAARQADKGIAAETFAADDGFEQGGKGAGGVRPAGVRGGVVRVD